MSAPSHQGFCVGPEGHLALTLEASRQGLAFIAPDRRIRSANGRLVELIHTLFGYTLRPDEDLTALAKGRSWSTFHYALGRALAGEAVEYCRFTAFHSGIWLLFSLAPLYEDGALIGVGLAVDDVTQQRAVMRENHHRVRIQCGLTTLSEIALNAESITYLCWKALEFLRDISGGHFGDLRLINGYHTECVMRLGGDGVPTLQGVDPDQEALSADLLRHLHLNPTAPFETTGAGWPEPWRGLEGQVVPLGEPSHAQGLLWLGHPHGHPTDAVIVDALINVGHLVASTWTRLRNIEALRESEQVLADAQQAAQIGSYSYELSSQRLKWTEETHQLFEIPSALGPPTVDVYLSRCHADDLPTLQDLWGRALSRGTPFTAEHRIRLPGDRVKWVQCTGRAIRNQEGAIVRLAGTTLDISEQKEAELELSAHRNQLARLVELRTADLQVANEALKESQQFLERLTSTTPNMLLAYDIHLDRPIFVNSRVELMTGYTPDEIIAMGSRALDQLLHPQDLEEARVAFNRVTRATPNETFEYEARICTRDGGVRWWRTLLTVLEMGEDGIPTQVLSTSQDITAHKAAEKALMESEALLAESQKVARVGSILYDYNKGLERMSAQAMQVYGLDDPTRRYRTRDLVRLIFPEDRDRLTHHIQEAAASNLPGYTMEYRIRRPDGAIRWINGRGRFERGPSGTPERLYATVQDVTERKEMVDRLQTALARQQELGELKTRFVSMVSHEFRTPLATIQGAAQMLDLYGDRLNPEAVTKQLAMIQRNTREMTALLEDILMLGRAESGRLRFNPTETKVEEAVQAFIEEFRLGLETEHTLHFTAPREPIIARLDANLFRHILGNLLTNAVKYSPKADRVDVVLRRLKDTPVNPEGALCLEVRDYGIGIPEGDQARLFEPFHRATNVGTIRGTGLGLCVLNHAVTHHGGHIQVHSREGKGTTFEITLPLNPPHTSSLDPTLWLRTPTDHEAR